MRFYILVSHNMYSFEQCLRNLISVRDRSIVVINTMDSDMEKRIIKYCNYYKFTYTITESDGTPATGKNAMMDIFRQSSDKYGTFVDGDDIITPTGIKYYTELSKRKDAPDVLCLYKQITIHFPHEVNWFEGMLDKDFPEKCNLRYAMDKGQDNIYLLNEDEIYEMMLAQGVSEEDAFSWSTDRYIFQQLMNRYSEDLEYMCRMVFFSQKGAEYVNYDNSLVVGEDTVQFMKLKKLALTDGKIRMFRKKDGKSCAPTYITNCHEKSITRHIKVDWSWSHDLTEQLFDMIANGEMPEPNQELPDFYLTT